MLDAVYLSVELCIRSGGHQRPVAAKPAVVSACVLHVARAYMHQYVRKTERVEEPNAST